MTDAPLTPAETDDALAAEYVLGVLDLAERSACEARIRREPGFAARVAAWENRLEGLNDDYTEAPAPNLLPAIEARLFPVAERRKGTVRFGLMRWLSGAAVAASVVLVGLATIAPPEPALIAVLATPDTRLSYEVRSFAGTLRVARVSGLPAQAGQVHELWIIAPGAAPVSLGLLDEAPLVVSYPAPPEGWILAVSVEPEGGSPSGVPTGPVILTTMIEGKA